MPLKTIAELDFGFSDAENYRRRENKAKFQQYFLRTEHLDSILESSRYFLVGEKGTGKTAYSVYLSNNVYHDTHSIIKYIRETDYNKFVSMKRKNSLELSDYRNIWEVIIYLLLSNAILESEGSNRFVERMKGMHTIKGVIDEYYQQAFSPEIIYAINFAEESTQAAELMLKHFGASGSDKQSINFSENKFQTNLMYLKQQFEKSIGRAKLEKNHILFVDGIDIRPSSIPYADYLECVKGLANAVWAINNDFLSSIKDSQGRIKVVLLLRPDIFSSLGLQNQNTKLRDNSVFLDWRATREGHRKSPLFLLVDKVLASQQSETHERGFCWDSYFPYDATNYVKPKEMTEKSSFIDVMRLSFSRPRDIITMLDIMKDKVVNERGHEERQFRPNDLGDANFRKEYSRYLLGEVKDQFSFYYTDEEYRIFLKFFNHLKGAATFSYEVYSRAFQQYWEHDLVNSPHKVTFPSTKEDFLQFLYELNIINYIVDKEGYERYVHWAFLERTYSNPSPKVELDRTYGVFYGLSKALNLGTKDY